MALGFVSSNSEYVFAEKTNVYITPEAKAIILQAQQKYGIYPKRNFTRGNIEANKKFLEAINGIESVYTEEDSERRVVIFQRGIIPDSKIFIVEHYNKYQIIPAYIWRLIA